MLFCPFSCKININLSQKSKNNSLILLQISFNLRHFLHITKQVILTRETVFIKSKIEPNLCFFVIKFCRV